jgi:hypothetical protein
MFNLVYLIILNKTSHPSLLSFLERRKSLYSLSRKERVRGGFMLFFTLNTMLYFSRVRD